MNPSSDTNRPATREGPSYNTRNRGRGRGNGNNTFGYRSSSLHNIPYVPPLDVTAGQQDDINTTGSGLGPEVTLSKSNSQQGDNSPRDGETPRQDEQQHLHAEDLEAMRMLIRRQEQEITALRQTANLQQPQHQNMTSQHPPMQTMYPPPYMMYPPPIHQNGGTLQIDPMESENHPAPNRTHVTQGGHDPKEEGVKMMKMRNLIMSSVPRWYQGSKTTLEEYVAIVETTLIDSALPITEHGQWAACLRSKLDPGVWTTFMASNPMVDFSDFYEVKEALLAQYGERAMNPNPFITLTTMRLTPTMDVKTHLENFNKLKQKIRDAVPDDTWRQTLLGTLDEGTMAVLRGHHPTYQSLVQDIYSKIPAIEASRRRLVEFQELRKLARGEARRVHYTSVEEEEEAQIYAMQRQYNNSRQASGRQRGAYMRRTPQEMEQMKMKGQCFACEQVGQMMTKNE